MAEEKKQEEVKSEEVVEEKKEEKPEEKKEEAKPEEKTEEPPKTPPPFILRVDLHCVGCTKKIVRSIMRIRGVVGVDIVMEKNELTIKGVVDPQAICNKIAKKTKRRAEVISPPPPSEGEPLPQVVVSQVNGLTTVELNVNMHCDACAEQLKSKILKLRGVQTVETNLGEEKVIVTGTMDEQNLVEYIRRRTKKQAKVVPQPEPEQKQDESKPEAAEKEDKKEEGADASKEKEAKEEEGVKKEEGEVVETVKEAEAEAETETAVVYEDEMGMKRMMYYYQPLYVIERLPALLPPPPPQLFSDENPNACSIS